MKILIWLDEHFAEGALAVTLTGRNTAKIRDRNGETAQLICNDKWEVSLISDPQQRDSPPTAPVMM